MICSRTLQALEYHTSNSGQARVRVFPRTRNSFRCTQCSLAAARLKRAAQSPLWAKLSGTIATGESQVVVAVQIVASIAVKNVRISGWLIRKTACGTRRVCRAAIVACASTRTRRWRSRERSRSLPRNKKNRSGQVERFSGGPSLEQGGQREGQGGRSVWISFCGGGIARRPGRSGPFRPVRRSRMARGRPARRTPW